MPTHHETHEPPAETAVEPDEKLVPVNEAIRYRKRAQLAEQRLTETQQQLDALQQRFDESQQTVTALERRQQVDALLTEADAIDLDAARLLTEVAVSHMDEPDVRLAVDDLRRSKPYLFRQGGPVAEAMPAQLAHDTDAAERAAQRAVESGNRRDLLAYLRLRRRHDTH